VIRNESWWMVMLGRERQKQERRVMLGNAECDAIMLRQVEKRNRVIEILVRMAAKVLIGPSMRPR
jgi:hypothetical protein